MVRTLSISATYALATYLAARCGSPALAAAHQICFQLWMASSLLADALAVSAQTLLARSLAAGEARYGRRVVTRTTLFAAVLGAVLAAALAAAANAVPGLFSTDAAVLQAVRALFPWVIASQPINALAFVWDGALFGAGGFAYAAGAMLGCAAPAIACMYWGSLAAEQAAVTVASAAGVNGGGAAAAGALTGRLHWVWAGLTLLMALRALVIAAPFFLKQPPFKQLHPKTAAPAASESDMSVDKDDYAGDSGGGANRNGMADGGGGSRKND